MARKGQKHCSGIRQLSLRDSPISTSMVSCSGLRAGRSCAELVAGQGQLWNLPFSWWGLQERDSWLALHLGWCVYIVCKFILYVYIFYFLIFVQVFGCCHETRARCSQPAANPAASCLAAVKHLGTAARRGEPVLSWPLVSVISVQLPSGTSFWTGSKLP